MSQRSWGLESRLNPLRQLPRPVWLLGFVSFLADVSGEMVYPVIPLFLTVTLGAPAVAVGLVEGVAEATANVTKLLSGRWSDRAGRRKAFVVGGYSIAAAGKAVIAASPIWPIAMAGRSLDRFGKGIRTSPRDAILADLATDSNRGLVFGLHRAMDTMGAVLGPIIGLGLIAAFDGHLRVIVALAVIPGLLSVWVLRWLPESRREAGPASHRWELGALPKRFYVLLGITVIFMLGNSSDAFLLLRSKDLGLSTTLVVLAYVAYNVVYSALAIPAGVISDRIPRSWLMALGWLAFAGVYAGFGVVDSTPGVWGLFMVYGVYMALTDGVSKALVADLAPGALRSTAMGLFLGATGITALVASVSAGLLWDHVSKSAPFVVGAGFASVAAVALAGFTLAGGFSERAPR